MRLQLVLNRPGAADAQTIVQVTADATTTVSAMARALASGPDGNAPTDSAQQLTLRVTDFAGGGAITLPPDAPVIDTGLRSGATVELAYPAADVAGDRGPVTTLVKVVAGPDAGLDVAIPRGSSLIGRVPESDIRVSDPRVSKIHARINVTDRVEIVDCGSSNGVLVGGVRVARAVVTPGDVVLLGDTEIMVVPLRSTGSEEGRSADFAYVRPPRVVARPTVRTIAMPQAPSRADAQRFPFLALIAPLVMGVALYFTTHSLLSLLFVGLSPILMIANFVDQKLAGKRAYARGVEAYREQLAHLTTEVAEGAQRERSLLEDVHPSVARCVAAVLLTADPLWARRPEHPEFLAVRLGTGTIPPLIDLEEREGPPAECRAEYRAFLEGSRALPDAPVAVSLPEVGAVGVCGERPVLDGVLRGIVLQLVALHSPAELVLTCLTSARRVDLWSWLSWLPHTSSPHSPLSAHLAGDAATVRIVLDQLEGVLGTRDSEGEGQRSWGPLPAVGPSGSPDSPVPAVVVVVDEPTIDAARLVRLAERGPAAGVHVLWVADVIAGLPGVCRAFLRVNAADGGQVGLVRREQVLRPVVCESVDAVTATRVARSLAPVVDGGRPTEDESDVPRSVPVVSVLGADSIDDADHTLARWRENRSVADRSGAHRPLDRPSDLRALVGHTGIEPFSLDLRTQGPHALVGGTTGAGKSEFLQAWILGMAYANSPDRVTFLFVDYKGGAAFAKCVQLPHCVGLVTDLSPYLVRRALRSLGAEIRRREHLLNLKRAKDLIELEKTGDPDCPPSLIIIVDEFAALVGEIPEFVDGVVDVAQRGRSLGLHLILATQRPSGVIKDSLRANTNLRVALRMADVDDSNDVLGTPMAAHFDPSIPGRAAAKTGPGRLVQFQSAFPGSKTPAVPPTPPIDVVELGFGTARTWKQPPRPGSNAHLPTDIDRVVESISTASRLGGIPAPRKPWLESLADSYNLEVLQPRTDTDILLGVIDDPDKQSQDKEYFQPDTDGNILYVGAGGSGKTTALRSLAVASAITPRGGPVHVYGMDFAGGSLRNLEILPHVGSIVAGDDDERIGRLLRLLVGHLDERSPRYRAAEASSLQEYRLRADNPEEPRLLVLLDGFTAFRNEYEGSISAGSAYMLFQRLLAEGRGVGIHVAMTVERPAALPSAISTAFARKVVLRQADEDAYTFYGLDPDVLSSSSPAGRAMQVDRPQELQLAIIGTSGNMAEQVRLMRELAPAVAKFHPRRPEPVRALPTSIPSSTLPDRIQGQPVLGVTDLDLRALPFDPTGGLVVAGPAQSGRTMALSWLAHALARAYPGIALYFATSRRSPLVSLNCWTDTATGPEQTAGMLTGLLARMVDGAQPQDPAFAVIVENAPEFVETDADSALTSLAVQARRGGHILISEGEMSQWTGSWGLVGELKNAKTGLLLQPDQGDGDTVLKTALPRVKRTDFPPGRGFWVKNGRVVKVQLPVVD